MDLIQPLVASGKAFLLAVALTPIVRDVFRAYNVVDRPGRRKVHAYPIPRIGGIPILIAYVIGLNFLRGPDSVFPVRWLQTILAGAAVIFLTGLIDDFLNLSPVVKLAGQIAASGVAFASGLSIDHLGKVALPGWISLAVTVFWLLLATNALNLIDGLDGLCGGIGFWATLTFFAVAVIHGSAVLAYTTLPLAGVLLGFLAFNFNPATVFLGDSGALTLGFLLGCFGIIWTGHQITGGGIALAFLALSVPLLDLGLAIVRRSLKGLPIFSADRGHIHHMLLARGLSVREAAFAMYGVSIAGGLVGIALTLTSGRPDLRELIIAVFLALIAFGVWLLRYPEFEVAGDLLLRGEFRSAFNARLRMKELEQALQRAREGDEWWKALVAAARAWNVIELKWLGPEAVREENLAARKPLWSFSIELNGGGVIRLDGDAQSSDVAPDLVRLAAILNRTFQGRARNFEQPAVS